MSQLQTLNNNNKKNGFDNLNKKIGFVFFFKVVKTIYLFSCYLSPTLITPREQSKRPSMKQK